jgi:hypothetical protein
MITREKIKQIESRAKRIYPMTEKEKGCINEYGKMIIRRGQFKKRVVKFIDYIQTTNDDFIKTYFKYDTNFFESNLEMSFFNVF